MQAEIIQDPSSYVELDPDMAQTLLDQKRAVSSCALSPQPLLTIAHSSHKSIVLTAIGFWAMGSKILGLRVSDHTMIAIMSSVVIQTT